MAWQTKFFDDFDNNLVDVQTYPGNGSITEPVGSELVLSAAASSGSRWDATNKNAPIAYEDLATYLGNEEGLIRVEARISSYASTYYNVGTGLCLWKDLSNAYFLYWSDSSNDTYVQQMVADAFTTLSSLGDYGQIDTDFVYRIYWNRTNRRRLVVDHEQFLEPYELGFAFSNTGGSTWTWQSYIPLFIPTRFGVYARHFESGFDVGFDYLKLEFDPTPDEYVGDDETKKPSTSAQVDDETTLLDAGGPPYWGDQVSRGQRVPGPSHQTLGSQGPFDDAQIDDEVSLLTPGGEAYGVEPGEGSLVPEELVQVEEAVIADLVDADYLTEKEDSDGTELIQGTTVEVLKKIDSGSDHWSAPTSGFYGTGRDGKNYYGGEECTPSGLLGTSFGTAAGGPNRRCWSFWAGAPPLDSGLPSGCTLSIPTDGVLRIACTGLGDEFEAASAKLGWYFSGDFDAQVDFANWAQSGGSYGRVCLRMLADEDNRVQIQRRSDGGYFSNRIVSGTDAGGVSSATSDTSGKFRITRTGSVLRTYYWDGVSSWVQLGSDHDLGRVDPMFPMLYVIGAGGTDVSVDFSGFTINSGAIINTVAWAREALGVHRGNADASPANLGLIATQDSLNLVDLASVLMWMRFTEGSGQPLNPDWGGTDKWVHDVAFEDGVMLIAWHGAMIRIDFNLSDIRIARLITDSNRGAVRKSTHGNGYAGVGSAGSLLNSHILTRNQDTGFSTPALDDWAIPSRDVNSVDLWYDSGYEYRAIGTASGLRIQKWRRWYFEGSADEGIETPDYATWDTANDILWTRFNQFNGDILWMDGTKMYSRNKTGAGQGWEDWMTGGSWASEYDKALPGTRSFRFQYRAVLYSSFIFMPADEGVYRVDWPSGSWELFYGKAESGATHEILPDYKLISAIAIGNDGSSDLLLLATDQGQRGQVMAIKLVDNTIYAKAEIVDLKIPSVIAA